MWKTEKEFGDYLKDQLKYLGMKPIRIESASTISGMPDMYVMGHGDYFIELKNMPNASVLNPKWVIPWRPGQQAWAADYKLHHSYKHSGLAVMSKCSWTFVGMYDGMICICMSRFFKKNIVRCNDPEVFIYSNDDLCKMFSRYRSKKIGAPLQFNWLLRTHSQQVVPTSKTLHEYICDALTYTLLDCELGSSIDEPYIDIPSFSDIKDELGIYDSMLAYETEIGRAQDFTHILRSVREIAVSIYISYLLNNRSK